MASAFDLLIERADALGEEGIQEILERVRAKEPISANECADLGWYLLDEGDAEESEALLATALPVFARELERNDEELLQVAAALALARSRLRRDAEARAGFEAVVAASEGPPTVLRAYSRARLARLDEDAGDLATAARQLELVVVEQRGLQTSLPELLGVAVLAGRVLVAATRTEAALEVLQRAREALGQAPGASALTVLLHTYLTAALLQAGRGEEAEASFETAMHLVEGSQPSLELARALNEALDLLAGLDASPHALRVAEAALETQRALDPDTPADPALEQNLAHALARTNRHEEAARHYRAALDGDPDPPLRATILSNLGDLHRHRGEFGSALTCLNEAHELQQGIDPRSRGAARKRNNLANVYDALGMHLIAYTARAEAVELHEEADADLGRPSANTANSLGGLAKTLAALGRDKVARDLYRRRLEIWEELSPHSEETATSHCHCAFAARAHGEAQLAWTHAETAVRTFRTLLARSPDAADAFDLFGHMQWEVGECDGAEWLFAKALAIRRELGVDPGHIAGSLGSLGALARERGDLEVAIERLEEAVAIAEGGRLGSGHAEVRMLSFGRSENEYQDLIAALFETGAAENHVRAFAIAEASRARVLLEQLNSSSPPPSAELCELEDREAAARDAVHEAAAAGAEPARLSELSFAVATAAEAVNAARARIAAASAPAAAPLELEQVQGLLDERTLLLEFDATGEDTFVWAVRAGDFAMGPLGMNGAELDAAVRWVVGSYAEGDRGHATGPRLRALADAVLGPVPERLWDGVERLVVVPDGALQALPFETLPAGPGEALIDRLAVAAAPSASVLASLAAREPAPIEAAEVLAVGDPAPPHLPPLPGARGEAEAVAARFPGRETTLIGEEATRARVLASLGGADLIHLATHGSVDDEAPEQSLLVFRDGPLRAYELPRTPLKASLVVCSACESGLGRNFPGEGLLGLSRGLLSAGARCAVASLWRVDDAATERLMAGFYDRLLAGEPPLDALRGAKLSLRKDYPDPYYWSSFIPVGAST